MQCYVYGTVSIVTTQHICISVDYVNINTDEAWGMTKSSHGNHVYSVEVALLMTELSYKKNIGLYLTTLKQFILSGNTHCKFGEKGKPLIAVCRGLLLSRI